MNISIPARVLVAAAFVSLFAGCASDRAVVTRYGPTAFTYYPQGAKVDGWGASDFALAFEGNGFSARSNSATMGGDAPSAWGSSEFGMNGKAVVVRSFTTPGQPNLCVVSVDGKYDTRLGSAITDWMIARSGLPERQASHRRPKRMPEPAAQLYAPALFGFDAEPARIADALRATAAAEGWTATEAKQQDVDGLTIGRYAFTDTAGRPVTVETFTPRFRPTLVEVSCASHDPNESLKVFNGVKERLGLPFRTPTPAKATATARAD